MLPDYKNTYKKKQMRIKEAYEKKFYGCKYSHIKTDNDIH